MGKTQQQQLLDESALLNIPSYYTTTNDSTSPASGLTFKRVCVFCGSSSGNGTVFSNVALDLGRELVKRNINLVYGGGNIGLMGQLAQTVQDAGGHVVGVIPKALVGPDLAGHTVGESIVVTDMHTRKAEMARRSDAFIALPGGYGTLEELLEVITWSQLKIHEKPVGLLNVGGYYDSLLTLFDNMHTQGFLKFNARTLVVSAPTPAELLDKLEAYTPLLDRAMPKLCWEVDYTSPISPITSRVQ